MKVDRIHLNKYYKLDYDPVLEIVTINRLDGEVKDNAKCVIVVPGGGYDFCSSREGDPICLPFLLRGYRTAKITYTTDPVNHKIMYPNQILETMAAMDYLKNHAKKYDIDKTKMAMIGFSAGGHLVASYQIDCNDASFQERIGAKNKDLKPQVVGLAYPVISCIEATHQGTIDNVTGKDPALFEKLSIEKQVKSDFPPTYLWSTMTDQAVPIVNTIVLDEALTKNNVKHKTHIYHDGPHGLSLATPLTALPKGCMAQYNYVNKEVSGWVEEALDFFDECLK